MVRAVDQLWAGRVGREKGGMAECLKKRRWRVSTEYEVTYMFSVMYIRMSRNNK
jgi:hypothetical protein